MHPLYASSPPPFLFPIKIASPFPLLSPLKEKPISNIYEIIAVESSSMINEKAHNLQIHGSKN